MQNKFKLALAATAIFIGPLCTAANAVPLSIFPPGELTLDGMSISNGNFVLTGATGFSDPGGVLTETTFLDPAIPGDDVTISATIGGSGGHFLIDVPLSTEVLHLKGFFDATTPDKPPAEFDIIVGVLNNASNDAFTYYLPRLTADFLFQITDLGSNLPSEIDNSDSFANGTNPIVALDASDPGLLGLTVFTLDNGIDNPWFVGVGGPSATTVIRTGNVGSVAGSPSSNCGFILTSVQAHGSSRLIRTPRPCPAIAVPAPNTAILFLIGLTAIVTLTSRRMSFAD